MAADLRRTQRHQRVEVRVPATTANLGPGFDCLGMALEMWNEVRLEVGGRGVAIEGEGVATLSRGGDNLVSVAVNRLFEEAGLPRPDLAIHCWNGIPLGRGLGSSAAAVGGGLLAANVLCGEPLSQTELLRLAVDLEGHPDNVAPAMLGGCQVVTWDGEELVTASVPLATGLRAILFIPEQTMPTGHARAILPAEVSRADAVFNLGRAALLVDALVTGRDDLLRIATQDRLHQPQREELFPPMRLIFRAALEAGALGVFLSGAGSTILALAREREMTIGYEMADMARKASVAGSLQVVNPSPRGAHVVSAE